MPSDDRVSRLSPEARATYDRIRALRDEIGPLEFDVVKAVRELRSDDENIPRWGWGATRGLEW